MKRPFSYIEEFIRQKLGLLPQNPTNDWELFEAKLKRALFIRRAQQGFAIFSLLLIVFWFQKDSLGFKNERVTAHQPASTILSVPEKSFIPPKSTNRNLAEAEALFSEAIKVAPKKSESFSEEAKPQESKPALVKASRLETIHLKPSTLAPDSSEIIKQPRLGLKQLIENSGLWNRLSNRKPSYISPLQDPRKWSYSVNIYPNFAFRKLIIQRRNIPYMHQDFIDAMQQAESSGMTMNVGLRLSRRIGPITYLNSGVEYINNSYEARFDFLHFRDANIHPVTGEIVNYQMLKSPERVAFNDVNSFHYLNIPLSISHQPWATKHLRINMELGFSLLYFLQAQGRSIDYQTLEIIDLDQRDYRKFIGSSSLKIGVNYYVNRKVNIGIEPTLMYFTNSIYEDKYPFELIPYSMGLNLNLQIKM